MKVFTPKTPTEINELLSSLADCHDGSIKRISFAKDRYFENGDLVYPFAKIEDFSYCDVEIEMLLNSYEGAKRDQIVLMKFIRTKSFTFMQTRDFDYSNIYEMKLESKEGAEFLFCFYATDDKVKALSLSCEELICEEL